MWPCVQIAIGKLEACVRYLGHVEMRTQIRGPRYLKQASVKVDVSFPQIENEEIATHFSL